MRPPELGGDVQLVLLEAGLVGIRQGPPPAVAAVVGVPAPPFDHFFLVARVVESVEHFLGHQWLSSSRPVQRGSHRRDATPQSLLLLLEQFQVRRERGQGVRVSCQHLGDRGQPQPQIAEQQAAITQARAQLDAAQTEVAFAAQQVERYKPLAASGAEPRERLAQLQTQARQTQEQASSAKAGLLAAQRRVDTLLAQVRQAKSQAEAARAQFAAARVNVESTLLRAAIDSRVGDLSVRVGQFVQPGTRMMTLVPVDRPFIQANFKETQLGLMRVGQLVRIEVDALPGVELAGRVSSLAPATGAQFSVLPPQNATGNFTKIVQRVPVRIAIATPPKVMRLLVPGMSVEVTVDTRSAKGELDEIRRAASQDR